MNWMTGMVCKTTNNEMTWMTKMIGMTDDLDDWNDLHYWDE